jgi:preprotein translocase subunit YajC
MHNFAATFATVVVAASSTSSKSTSSASSAGTLIFILLLAVLAYVFFIRPRSAQARRQRDTLQQVSVGDEILTGAGIFGRVLDIEADRLTIETAPGTRITVLRSTIARRLTEPPPEETNWDAEEPSSDSDHGSGSASAGEASSLSEGSGAAADDTTETEHHNANDDLGPGEDPEGADDDHDAEDDGRRRASGRGEVSSE